MFFMLLIILGYFIFTLTTLRMEWDLLWDGGQCSLSLQRTKTHINGITNKYTAQDFIMFQDSGRHSTQDLTTTSSANKIHFLSLHLKYNQQGHRRGSRAPYNIVLIKAEHYTTNYRYKHSRYNSLTILITSRSQGVLMMQKKRCYRTKSLSTVQKHCKNLQK